MNNQCPCKNCIERAVGCHGTCGYYNSWKEVQSEEYRKEYADRLVTMQLTETRFSRTKGKHISQALKHGRR